MLTQIDVVSESPFEIPILGATPKDIFLPRKITGLNPPARTLFIGEYSRDGGTYQGRRVGNRNVVVTMDLNPDPALGQTVSGLREFLYKQLIDSQPDADHLKLLLHDDALPDRYLYGYCETFETDIFDSESTVQVSFVCPDPYIRDDVRTVLTHPSGWIVVPFTYAGTADTGFEVEIHITGATNWLTLQNNNQFMVFNKAFVPGDVVVINTEPGSRSATITRSGDTSSLLPALSPYSPWISLSAQENTLRVHGETYADVIASIKELSYVTAFWGI